MVRSRRRRARLGRSILVRDGGAIWPSNSEYEAGQLISRCTRLVTMSVVVVLMMTVAPAAAQRQSLPVDLPDGPAAEGFDVERFSNAGNGWFETFHVERTERLDDALEAARVASETRVLVIETAAGALALLQGQMAFHHIAQGRAGGKDWIATF